MEAVQIKFSLERVALQLYTLIFLYFENKRVLHAYQKIVIVCNILIFVYTKIV